MTSDQELWRDLCEKDDRTSPEEYPDMALITEDEFLYVCAEVRRQATAAEYRRLSGAVYSAAEMEEAKAEVRRATVEQCAQDVRRVVGEAQGKADSGMPLHRVLVWLIAHMSANIRIVERTQSPTAKEPM